MRESATPPCAPGPAVSSLDASGGPGVTVKTRLSIASTSDPTCRTSTKYVPFVYGVKFAAYVPEDVAFAAFAEILNGRVFAAVVLPSAFSTTAATPPSLANPTAVAPAGAVTRSSNPSSPSACRFPKWSRASTTKATGVPAGDAAGVGPPVRDRRRERGHRGNTSPGTTVTVSPWSFEIECVPSVASRVKFPLLVASNTSSYDPSRASSREASNATASTAVPRAPTSVAAYASGPNAATYRASLPSRSTLRTRSAERTPATTTRSVAVTSYVSAPYAIGALDVLEKASPGSASIAVADAAGAATRSAETTSIRISPRVGSAALAQLPPMRVKSASAGPPASTRSE